MISVETTKKVYSGPNTTGPFPFPFKVFALNDLEVHRVDAYGVAYPMARSVDYDISGVGLEGGGSITLKYPLPSGNKLVIRRHRPYLQSQVYTANNPFTASAANSSLDKVVMEIQQVREIAERGFQVPRDDELGIRYNRPKASTLIGWDAAGQQLENYPITPMSIPPFRNLADYDSLFDAVESIGSAVVTLVVASPTVVDENLTVPENITLFFLKGGIVTVVGGVELIVESMMAGPHQAFECMGDGKVTLSHGSCDRALMAWWGVSKDRSAEDNTDRINRAILCGVSLNSILTQIIPSVNHVVLTEDVPVDVGIRLGLDSAKLKYLTVDLGGHTLDASGAGTGKVFSFLGGGSSALAVERCRLVNGKILGNLGDSDPTQTGLYMQSAVFNTIQGVVVEGCLKGLHEESASTSTTPTPATWNNHFYDFQVLRCMAEDLSGVGIHIDYNVNGTKFFGGSASNCNQIIKTGGPIDPLTQRADDLPSDTQLYGFEAENGGCDSPNGIGVYTHALGFHWSGGRYETHGRVAHWYVDELTASAIFQGVYRGSSNRLLVNPLCEGYIRREDNYGLREWNKTINVSRHGNSNILGARVDYDDSPAIKIVGCTIEAEAVFEIPSHGLLNDKLVHMDSAYTGTLWDGLVGTAYLIEVVDADHVKLKHASSPTAYLSTVGFPDFNALQPPIESISIGEMAIVGWTGHGRSVDDTVRFGGVTQSGYSEFNNHGYAVVAVLDSNTLQIDLDTSELTDEYDSATDGGYFDIYPKLRLGGYDNFQVSVKGDMKWSSGYRNVPDAWLKDIGEGILQAFPGISPSTHSVSTDGSQSYYTIGGGSPRVDTFTPDLRLGQHQTILLAAHTQINLPTAGSLTIPAGTMLILELKQSGTTQFYVLMDANYKARKGFVMPNQPGATARATLTLIFDGSYWVAVNMAVDPTSEAPTWGSYSQGCRYEYYAPTESGSGGSKYVKSGGICTVGGSPGTWVDLRNLTGN